VYEGVRKDLPLTVPEDSWIRVIHDPIRGEPALHFCVAWVAKPVLHLAVMAGFTTASAEECDGIDEREIVSHRRISLETISNVQVDFATGRGTVELLGGEKLEDPPVLLIQKYM